MALNINDQFDLHSRVLGLANQRLELLADNVANADTPNYKARDIDFRSAMASAGQPGTLGGDLPMAATRTGQGERDERGRSRYSTGSLHRSAGRFAVFY